MTRLPVLPSLPSFLAFPNASEDFAQHFAADVYRRAPKNLKSKAKPADNTERNVQPARRQSTSLIS